jgi:hypothetical protein
MYHSDLRKEIAYLQAQLEYKRRKLGKALQENIPLIRLSPLYEEIKVVEEKLQICMEEANTQFDNGQ